MLEAIHKNITNVALLIILSLFVFTAVTPIRAHANDWDSFSTCENRVLYKQKNIYSDIHHENLVGRIKVFKCTGHFFAYVTNLMSNPSGIDVEISRRVTHGWYVVGDEVSGRYNSISYMIKNPSGTQTFSTLGIVKRSGGGIYSAGFVWTN